MKTKAVVTGEDIVHEARRWIGTRFRHQARARGVATDCLGMVGGVAANLALVSKSAWLEDPAFKQYGRIPIAEVLYDGCERYLRRIQLKEVQLGDVVVMAFQGDHPQHFAILSSLEPMRIIHAYAQLRGVRETSADIPKAKILRAYRFRGVAE